MQKAEREAIKNTVKQNQRNYVGSIVETEYYTDIKIRIKNLQNKINRFLRTEYASKNSLKQIPNLSRIIFGLQEDMKRFGINIYEFDYEKKLLNNYLMHTLDGLIVSRYNSQCASYGETLLNCYLDLYITFTTLKMEKEIGMNPLFLVNPLTGNNLELDVLFEDYKLAFEFQGEHHYNDLNVSTKDSLKLSICKETNRILIPVNIIQLNSNKLGILILNSIKEQMGLNKVVNHLDFTEYLSTGNSRKNLIRFFKVTQRSYLANQLFEQTLRWLDTKSDIYITNMQERCPISATMDAPRLLHSEADLDIVTIYNRIPMIRKGCI